jgi:hypothetical protein
VLEEIGHAEGVRSAPEGLDEAVPVVEVGPYDVCASVGQGAGRI